jgi:hypothetical protein
MPGNSSGTAAKQLLLRAMITALAITLAACADDGHLRGSISPSPDDKTYFAVTDDNGGACGPILLDGVAWTHGLGEMAPIQPGLHTIECGARIEFNIPVRVIFRFDYWGP